jgi:hypothetical protein
MGIAWAHARGPKDRDKCAAWVDVTSTTAFGQLIVWDSGEAGLSAGSTAGPITNQHYDLESARDLEAAVRDLLRPAPISHFPRLMAALDSHEIPTGLEHSPRAAW